MRNPFHIQDAGASCPHRYIVELPCGIFQHNFFEKHGITETGFLWEKAASYFWKTQADCTYPVWYCSEAQIFRIGFNSPVLAHAFANLFYKKCRSTAFLRCAFSFEEAAAASSSKDSPF